MCVRSLVCAACPLNKLCPKRLKFEKKAEKLCPDANTTGKKPSARKNWPSSMLSS